MRAIFLLLIATIFIVGCTANEKTNDLNQGKPPEQNIVTGIQTNNSGPENNPVNETISKPNGSVSNINAVSSNVSLNNSRNAAPALIQLDRYIMAFLACDTSASSCNDPKDHETYLAQSNDGTSWEPLSGFKPYPGSVPDAIRRNNTIYIYNPGSLTRYHLDSGIEEAPIRIKLEDSNGESAIFVDPSIIEDDGTLILFYLPGIMGQDPARCPTGQTSCTKQIMSATEVRGSDGSVFTIDKGARANIQISGNIATASDPAVFKGPDGYYLYVSEGQSVIALFSQSLQGSYDYIKSLQNGVLVPQGTGGVPAGYYDSSTGQYWTFVTQGSHTQIIRLAKTSNLNGLIPDSSFTTVISGCTFSGLGCSYSVASPGVHIGNPGQ